ncbi:MAG TPA: hypothetical protein PKE26_16020 [Kiritimatiellia bacterium]|nr:hypothetical protein [Saprospiraceae bacterium]HMP00604.1 hypothetical protein [Kiritimatiellia bacterium]
MRILLLALLLIYCSSCASNGIRSTPSDESKTHDNSDDLIMTSVSPGLPPIPLSVNETNNYESHSEELQRQLQEHQMEMIRQGLPALAIPLTPESEQQLIKEGYLSPEN